MRSSLRRMTCTVALVFGLFTLIVSVVPRMPSASSSTNTALMPLTQFCNPSSITINPGGAASPYPSNIAVSGQTGVITGVTVTLNNFSHTFPDDVDILLVGPGAQNAIILSDVGGGTGVSNLTLTLDDAAATSLPNGGPLVSGTFKPTDIADGTEIFPSPAPAPSGASALSVFNGTNPNGTWSLYVKDDTSGDGGSIAGGWCLNITTSAAAACVLTCPSDVTQANTPGQCGALVTYAPPTTSGICGTVTCSPPSGSFFPIGTTTVNCSEPGGGTCSFTVTVTGVCLSGCNPTSITIPTGGAASPYPSKISISGQTGVITNVSVTLTNFSHTFPDDVDILLVGPNGQNALIFSDVGGGTAVSALNFTLDDGAATSLPNSGPLVSGTFKPTDIVDGAEVFPAPAPAPSGASAFSVFNGTPANGVWSLYVKDDTAGDGGSIAGGWCLNITTAAVAPCVLTCPADVSQSNTPGQCGAFVTYPTPGTTGFCGTVACSPASGSFFPIGATTVTCTASAGGSCSFMVTVTGTCPSGCNPTSITINAGGAASPYPSGIAISGVSGTVATVTVTLNNFSHTFPDDVDILLVGPAGQNAIIMSDVGGGIVASNVTLTLTDATAASLPDNGPLVSGTFKPTNIGGGEVFPAPAPAPSGGSVLSVFNGTDPNGTWRLYVNDDTGGDGGSISGGWCLNITATPPPCTITCPPNPTVSNDAGQCGAVVNYSAPTTTGSCGTVTCAPASGSFFPVGATPVNCTTSAGPSCSFSVTVKDTEAPTCNLPANITQGNASGQCSAVVTYTATASDNCPGASIVCNPASGSTFPVGTTTVNCTASDASPDSADTTCSFTVTIKDTEAPTCNLPANITQNNTSGQCAAVVTYSATASDNCPGASIICNPASGSSFPVGTTTVNCTASDASPDSPDTTCSFTVTIKDVQAPTCNLPANITQNNTPGQCSRVVTYTATASDNCPGASIVCNPPSGSTFPVGTTTVNCTASDASPDSPDTSCSFTVTIIDNQPPTIVCPADVTATAATGQTSAIVSYPAPAVSDNCPGATFVCLPASGSSFPLGTTTVTCTATDAHANQASCTFKVTVSGTFLINADSFLRDGADNTNEGGNNLLRIQSSGHNRVVVRFNLTGISTVGLQSATLVLNITDNSDNWGSTGRLVDAHRLLADWTEGNGHTVGDQPNFRGTGEGVTWNCAKDSNIANQNDDCLSQWNGGTFAAATASPVLHTNGQLGDVSWNVTADVLAGATNGWVIKKQNEGQAGQVKYYSKEGAAVAGNPNLGPRLVLVYAP